MKKYFVKVNFSFSLFLIILIFGASGCTEINDRVFPEQQPYWPTGDWRISSPEEQSMDSEKLSRMLTTIEEMPQLEVHSILLIRNGTIVLEKYYPPYSQTKKHALFSCTKSVISALIGIAIQEGHIEGVDQSILEFFPEYITPNLDLAKEKIRLEDVLTMRSGLAWQEGNLGYQGLYLAKDWYQYMLDKPLTEEPGVNFNYCSGCSHLLSGVIQKSTGMQTQDFAKSHLFEPLGIQDYFWEKDAGGNAIGGWGLELTPRDMAKFGYLFLQNGRWDGKQIIPSEWIRESTQGGQKVTDMWNYGYQWWIDPSGKLFAAQGMHGQKIYVLPDQAIVIVVTAGNDDASTAGDLVVDSAISSLK